MKKTASGPKPKTAGRPAGGGALSKQRITEAALAHIDEFGLGAFSMREIAAQLGVYPATVHWHVSTREALLAEVAAAVMAGVTPPPDKRTWQEWIAELFRRCRAAVRRHPNVAQLLGAQLVSNGSLPIELVEGVLAALCEAGFEGQSLLEAYNCVIAAMLGFVTMEFSPLPSDNTQAWAEELRERVHTIRPLDHPVLTRNLPLLANQAFIVRWDNGTTVPLDSSFERHIQITIDGLEAFVRRL
jgi:AcrR family transcriptional regulator